MVRSWSHKAFIVLVVLVAGCASGSPPIGTAAPHVGLTFVNGPLTLPSNVRRSCPEFPPPGFARCIALVRTDRFTEAVHPATVAGYGPADLRAAYALPSLTNGAGKTVAIVDAYDDPSAEADLAIYRTQFGEPACTTANGCFRRVNQNGKASGYPAVNAGWDEEISLDVDMVSAICPNCKILLVEAAAPSFTSLGTAEATAVRLGATAVSNSYGGPEFSSEVSVQSAYDHPGVMITASSGDSGYGPQFPAASRYVTAVGGTTLSRDSSARGFSETAWAFGGSGCSAYVGKPSWQHDKGCTHRTIADVSAVADPNTGVAVVYNGNWLVFGGTSVSSPIIASVYALAGNAKTSTFAQDSYLHPSALFDVTSGSDGSCAVSYLCTAGVGYDGPTGNGTPNGLGAF